jgi:hypothetical protein
VAITSHLFILTIRVGGLQAPRDLGVGEELVVEGDLFEIRSKDIHILGRIFKCGDHTLGRVGTWTSYAGLAGSKVGGDHRYPCLW